MATLLLRLAGPMQAWGTESRWEIRDSGREPSKSGVVGLLAAALGRGREQAVDDLARLRMAIRVEQEGILKKDYQTAADIVAADGGPPRDLVSTRYYLSDAEFLVALEGPENLLEIIEAAMDAPVYPLFLGRKSYLPSVPVGIPGGLYSSTNLRELLQHRPWEPTLRTNDPPRRLRVVEEVERTERCSVRRDQPLGACFSTREFGLRYVSTYFVETPTRPK